MNQTYSDCYYCGGQVEEQRVMQEVWWKGRLHLIDGVPAGVCAQCGEKFILRNVAKAIDQLLAGEVPPDQLVEVPSYHFREIEQVA